MLLAPVIVDVARRDGAEVAQETSEPLQHRQVGQGRSTALPAGHLLDRLGEGGQLRDEVFELAHDGLEGRFLDVLPEVAAQDAAVEDPRLGTVQTDDGLDLLDVGEAVLPQRLDDLGHGHVGRRRQAVGQHHETLRLDLGRRPEPDEGRRLGRDRRDGGRGRVELGGLLVDRGEVRGRRVLGHKGPPASM